MPLNRKCNKENRIGWNASLSRARDVLERTKRYRSQKLLRSITREWKTISLTSKMDKRKEELAKQFYEQKMRLRSFQSSRLTLPQMWASYYPLPLKVLKLFSLFNSRSREIKSLILVSWRGLAIKSKKFDLIVERFRSFRQRKIIRRVFSSWKSQATTAPKEYINYNKYLTSDYQMLKMNRNPF